MFLIKVPNNILFSKHRSKAFTWRLAIFSAVYKGVEILEAEACSDHIHMVVSIPPKLSVSQFMGYLKGKSSLMIFDRHANLKYKYGDRQFWCKGYYVDTVGRNEKAIREYVRNQLQEDIADDQISLKEYMDPFTGEPVNKGKR